MKEHLHSWRFYLGWAIGYNIKEILHTAQIYDYNYLSSLFSFWVVFKAFITVMIH